LRLAIVAPAPWPTFRRTEYATSFEQVAVIVLFTSMLLLGTGVWIVLPKLNAAALIEQVGTTIPVTEKFDVAVAASVGAAMPVNMTARRRRREEVMSFIVENLQ
jgi:hypothetical protein